MKPNVWLLSAYRSDSHAHWVDWLVTHITRADWQVRELPGRHFAWRIRSNPLSWLDSLPETAPDLVLATSMVDLATLKGLHPRLAHVPCWYYFHENQYVYPVRKRQVRTIEPRMIQLYGALAADRLLFNSEFNRQSFFDGIEEFLKLMPDQVPPNVSARLHPRSQVLPVPVDPVPRASMRDTRLILWNHRWEYDKAPEIFCAAILALADQGIEFQLALLGKRPRIAPEPLQRLRNTLPERIVADGHLPDDQYRALLGRAGIVVSTAIHEFQGISMLEATSAGACPLVPDALCYREQYPPEFRYPAGQTDALVSRLRKWLTAGPPGAPQVNDWLSPALAPAWQNRIDAALGQQLKSR